MNRKKGLLEKKEEEDTELMTNLISHFRSIISSRMKEVQDKVGLVKGSEGKMNACNAKKKDVMERNITPYQDFYSRILAYCVAGITVVGSVIICRCCYWCSLDFLLFVQACFSSSSS